MPATVGGRVAMFMMSATWFWRVAEAAWGGEGRGEEVAAECGRGWATAGDDAARFRIAGKALPLVSPS